MNLAANWMSSLKESRPRQIIVLQFCGNFISICFLKVKFVMFPDKSHMINS